MKLNKYGLFFKMVGKKLKKFFYIYFFMGAGYFLFALRYQLKKVF